MTNLSKCPCCGGEAQTSEGSACSWVDCAKCGLSTDEYETLVLARTAWNLRADVDDWSKKIITAYSENQEKLVLEKKELKKNSEALHDYLRRGVIPNMRSMREPRLGEMDWWGIADYLEELLEGSGE